MLSINTSKCETVSFCCAKPPKLYFANINIPDKPHLGVQLDPKPNYCQHISYVAKQLKKLCRLMYRVRYMYPMKCLLSFCNSYAKYVINHDSLIYGNAKKSNLETKDQAQCRILKAIFFSKRNLKAWSIYTNKEQLLQYTRCSSVKFFAKISIYCDQNRHSDLEMNYITKICMLLLVFLQGTTHKIQLNSYEMQIVEKHSTWRLYLINFLRFDTLKFQHFHWP